jgi:hypothetical protein
LSITTLIRSASLRSQTDARQETETAVFVYVLNRMLTLGRSASVRIT